jgi:hypothetical protein
LIQTFSSFAPLNEGWRLIFYSFYFTFSVENGTLLWYITNCIFNKNHKRSPLVMTTTNCEKFKGEIENYLVTGHNS